MIMYNAQSNVNDKNVIKLMSGSRSIKNDYQHFLAKEKSPINFNCMLAIRIVYRSSLRMQTLSHRKILRKDFVLFAVRANRSTARVLSNNDVSINFSSNRRILWKRTHQNCIIESSIMKIL